LCSRRRRLVKGAALAPFALLSACGGGMGMMGGSMCMAGDLPALTEASTEHALPVIPLDEGSLDGAGAREFALQVQAGTSSFFDGVATRTLGYNGPLLGRALKLRTGEPTRIRVRNGLGEPTTVHWHGLVVPAEVDGGPHQPIAAGALWTASFTVSNPASTCWYHPHLHGATGRQVVAGLAGLLIVDDGLNPGLLPGRWGVDDLAVVLQDKRFDAGGQIDYALTDADRATGYGGNVLLANGVAGAMWQAPAQWVRLRLLNGCNARILNLWLAPSSASPLQIANEGGLLPSPVVRSSLVLAPGERAEVLLDLGGLAAGSEVALMASSVGNAMDMGMMSSGNWGALGAAVPALKMRVTLPRQPDAIAGPPSRLTVPAPMSLPASTRSRTIALDGMMGPPFTINARLFDLSRVDFAVRAGVVEAWRIYNGTMMAHPMHVHGVRMVLMSREGGAVAAHERGPRDTFLIGPLEALWVAVEPPAAASGTPLVFHCHILEHEDAGMMGQFIVGA
jgi:FtsP/CotA-like multicopper oxidase with cupredoxin domain